MIIVNEQPFSLVENKGFRDLVRVVQPILLVPSCIIVAWDCLNPYGKELQALKEILRQRIVLPPSHGL